MFIKGVGMTRFDASTKTAMQLINEACFEALSDADMNMDKIDAICVSNLDFPHNGERQKHIASMCASLFQTTKPIIRVPAACAGGGAAFTFAHNLQDDFDNIMVVGVDKITSMPTPRITDEYMQAAEGRWEQPEGLTFPTQNALVAQEYMSRYDATLDDLSLIAFKNHQNAFHNPKAKFYQKEVTLDKIRSSPVVTSPLRLMDCSVSVDGAAACILTKDKTPVEVAGVGIHTDYLGAFERADSCTWEATVKSTAAAYDQAGITASNIDFAELHDAFTIVEMIAYEDVGFAKKGEGAKLIRDGEVKVDGRIPVNVSGGLKAKGHPVSATGLSQIYEVTRQLRRDCGDRQLPKYVKYGLTQNIGGAGATISSAVLRKVSA